MSDVVLFKEVELSNKKRYGLVTLNVEKTLNSLSLDMIDLMSARLISWATDNEIAFVFFQGAGDRAFSAGGDIQALYQSILTESEDENPYTEQFFEREYRLDYLIKTYPKPTIVWAQGIVMGGGLGIMRACDIRIGMPSTRIAMPEITIGLFPDAGATWTFSQMPKHWAYFLAWTGAAVKGIEAKTLNFVNYLLDPEQKSALDDALATAVWGDTTLASLKMIVGNLDREKQTSAALEMNHILQHDKLIDQVVSEALANANPIDKFAALQNRLVGDKWLENASAAFQRGSPTTASIILQQFRRAENMTLAEMFNMELVIAIACTKHPDFAEGVRALLIDKDNKPDWRYKKMGDVPDAWIDEHFEPPWTVNPLSKLATI